MCLFYILPFLLFSVEGGELIVAKSPLSVTFTGDDPIDQHLLPEVFAAAMGFTTHQESDWSGMSITDPFSFAEAVAILYVDGVSTLGKHTSLPKFSVNNDEDEFTTWKKIKNKVNDRYPLENNTLLRIELGHAEKNTGNIETKHLNKSIPEDAEFLKELVGLNGLINIIKGFDGVPDLYWFSMKSLHSLSDFKGVNHVSTVEAKQMVSESLLKLADAFGSVYHDKALVVALVSDASHTRRARSVGAEANENLNVIADVNENIYDPDFPVIFNIILWFTVALLFSLLAVSVFIASMDPGRDSIIYRMTSNRMKKDS